jgi:hypothetical protein
MKLDKLDNVQWEDIFPNKVRVYKVCAVLCVISLGTIILCSYMVTL